MGEPDGGALSAASTCPKGDDCALNDGAVYCFHCRRNWPRDETWDVPFEQRPDRRRRDTPVVLVAKTEQDARDLLSELADDPRVAMAHVDLGDGKYLLPERDRG